jgi:hypothetical protein
MAPMPADARSVINMCPLRFAGAVLVAGCVYAPSVLAQHPTINDQMNTRALTPPPQVDSYLSVTVAQLLVALGLNLQGMPATELRRMYVIRQPHPLAAAPASPLPDESFE